MFCSQCRAQIDEDSKFCRLCGNPTSALVTKPSSPAAEHKFQQKYLYLLIGIMASPLVERPGHWLFWVVPCGLIGFTIGAIIDQLIK